MNPSNYKTQAQKAVNKGFIIESYLFLGSGSGIGGGGGGGTSSYLYQKETTTYKSGGGSGGVSGGGAGGGSSSNYNMAYGESTTADYDMATPANYTSNTANYTSNTLSSSMGSGLGGGGGGTLGGSNTMSNTMSKSEYNTMSSYSYQVRNRCPLFSVISWFVCFCYCGVFFMFVIHLLISKHG